jgi:hypothetical protein
MAVGAHELERVAGALCAGEISAAAVADLRRSLPGVSLSLCDVCDVDTARRFRSFPAFDLFLIDGRTQSWRLTSEPSEGTGVMIARRTAAP